MVAAWFVEAVSANRYLRVSVGGDRYDHTRLRLCQVSLPWAEVTAIPPSLPPSLNCSPYVCVVGVAKDDPEVPDQLVDQSVQLGCIVHITHLS